MAVICISQSFIPSEKIMSKMRIEEDIDANLELLRLVVGRNIQMEKAKRGWHCPQ